MKKIIGKIITSTVFQNVFTYACVGCLPLLRKKKNKDDAFYLIDSEEFKLLDSDGFYLTVKR